MYQKIGGPKQVYNLQYDSTTAIWRIERVSRVGNVVFVFGQTKLRNVTGAGYY